MTTRESAGKDEMIKCLRCQVSNLKTFGRSIVEKSEALDKKKGETIKQLNVEVQRLNTFNGFQQNLLAGKNEEIEKLSQHLQAKNEECKKVKDLQNQLFQCKEWAGKRAIDISQMKEECDQVKTSKMAEEKVLKEKLLSARRMISQKANDAFQLKQELEALKQEMEALKKEMEGIKKENENMSEAGKDKTERSKSLIVSLNKSLAESRKEIDELTIQLRAAKRTNSSDGNYSFNLTIWGHLINFLNKTSLKYNSGFKNR
jgi:predicted RNase H-like nuclease (RuvC/YqgF family)